MLRIISISNIRNIVLIPAFILVLAVIGIILIGKNIMREREEFKPKCKDCERTTTILLYSGFVFLLLMPLLSFII